MMIVVLAVVMAGILFVIIVQGTRQRRESLPELAQDYLDGANLLLSEDKPKRVPQADLAAGIRDMLEAGQIDEAVEVYQKFTGVDQYTARDAVYAIAQGMDDVGFDADESSNEESGFEARGS
jgi:hypothetical protein